MKVVRVAVTNERKGVVGAMNKRWRASVVVGLVIGSASVVWAAHQGREAMSNTHVMSVEGTISELDVNATASTLKLTTLENRVETLVINPTTRIVGSNGTQTTAETLRVGQRATIQYVEDHGRQVATSIALLSPEQPVATPAAAVDAQRTSQDAGEQ